MKKVIIINFGNCIGGVQRRFFTLINYYLKNPISDYKLYYFINRSQLHQLDNNFYTKSSNKVSIVKFGVPYNKAHYKKKLVFFIDFVCLFIKLLFYFSFKKVYAYHYINTLTLSFVSIFKAKHNVYSLVDPTNELFTVRKKSLSGKLLKFAIRKNVKIDCLSEDIRKELLTSFPSASKQTFTSPCSFIDYSKTRIGEKKNIICFCARFIEWKGCDLLLEVLSELALKYPFYEFKILGYGPYGKLFRKQIKDNALSNVHIGYSNEPVNEFINTQIFLSLQKDENYPSQSLIEAMACGNAIIATDVGLTRKIVNEDVGRLIKYDANELIQAVDALILDKKRIISMGKLARERIMKEHKVDIYADYCLNTLYL